MSEDAGYPVAGAAPAPAAAPGAPGTGGTSALYPLTPAAAAAAAVAAEPVLIGGDFLGFGIIRPWRRDQKLDWAAVGGVRLVKSAVGQILATRASSERTTGELPWRTEFGSLLYLLRHRANDETTREIARTYVAGALKRWEPRILVTGVTIVTETVAGQGEVAMAIRVRFKLATSNTAGNQVFLPGLEVEVPLG